MVEADPQPDEFDPRFYGVIGNITSDWALLEYKINQCIWRLAHIEHDQLGACITAQITTFQSRIEAMRLLCMERGISKRRIEQINKFINAARPLLEARNRAAHDPIGTENGKHVQLQITARGKSVFDIREVTLDELVRTRDQISAFNTRFDDLANEILHELRTLPYSPGMIFPQITRVRIGRG